MRERIASRRRFNLSGGSFRGKRSHIVAGAAIATVLGGAGALNAATWVDPAAVTPLLSGVPASAPTPGYFSSTVALKDGDVIKTGAFPSDTDGLKASTVYYVVGAGSVPTFNFRLSGSPGGTGLITPVAPAASGAAATTMAFDWNTAANWVGGAIPNGVDASATIASNVNTTAISFNKDTTLGSLNFSATSNDLNLISTITANAGPWANLNFATSNPLVTPTITISGGKSLFFSDSAPANLGNIDGKLQISGNQGLIIDNQNPLIGTTLPTNAAPPNSSAGAVKFGYFIDWSKFTGALTLKEGAFSLQGGGAGNGISCLPINNDVILGANGLAAQLEIWGNGSNTNNYVRGLDGDAQSTIINSGTSGGPSINLGSYSVSTDTYTYNGSMGVPISNTQPGTGSPAVNFSVPANLRLLKMGAGTQNLLGNNNISNQNLVVINGGTLSLGATGTIGTVTGTGQASAGTVMGDTAPSNYFNGEALLMHNGEFKIVGTPANPRSQSFGGAFSNNGTATKGISNGGLIQPNGVASGTSLSGASYGLTTLTVDDSLAPNQPASLNFYAVQPRNLVIGPVSTDNANGVTTLFRGTNLGSTPGNGVGSITFTLAPAVGGSLGSAGYLNASDGAGALNTTGAAVIKGALADTTATGHGMGFATYDPAVGVRLLNGSEQDTSGYPTGNVDSVNNVRLNLTGPVTIAGVRTNTLQLDNSLANGSTGAVTVTNTTAPANPYAPDGSSVGTGAYFIPANGLLFSGDQPITLAGGTLSGTASWDGEDVVIHSINTSAAGVTIASSIDNRGASNTTDGHATPGWITYNGPGNFTITGSQTLGNSGGISFNGTGTTTLDGAIMSATVLAVNQGTVKFTPANSVAPGDPGSTLPSSSKAQLIVASGATVDLNGTPSSQISFDSLGVPALYVNAGPNAAGGTITNSSSTRVDLLLNGAGSTAGLFPGVISGNLNLVLAKTAGKAQVLTGTNTYTGDTTIFQGNTLTIGRFGNLPSTTNVTLGDVSSNTAGILVLGDGNSSTDGASAAISQTVASLTGVGTLVLPAVNAVEGANANTSILTVNYTNASTPDTYTGAIGNPSPINAGPGSLNNIQLHKTGAGTLVLSSPASAATPVPNWYTGGTVIEGGTLSVASDNKLGGIGSIQPGSADVPSPSSVIPDNIIINGGTLQTTGTFTLGDAYAATTPATPDRRGVGIGPVSGSTGGTGTIEVTATNTLTANAAIESSGNTGVNTLVKTGLGGLTLGGASVFGGNNTNIQNGKLSMNGSMGTLATPTGTVTVGNLTTAGLTPTLAGGTGAANGGTLAGSVGAALDYYASSTTVGDIQGQISLLGAAGGSAGHLAPGNSVGTLTVAGLTTSPGSVLDYEFNSTSNDFVDVTGTGDGVTTGLVLAGGGFNLYQEGTTTLFDTPGTYHVMEYAGALGGSVTSLSVLNPDGHSTYSFNTAAGPGGTNYVNLTVSAVPEPVSTALLGLGALGLLGRRSRRRTSVV